jgi:hypothetical protein
MRHKTFKGFKWQALLNFASTLPFWYKAGKFGINLFWPPKAEEAGEPDVV